MHTARLDVRLTARIVRARPLEDPRTGVRACAASGAILRDGRLFVVEDDSLSAAWIDPVTLSIERVPLLEDGGRRAKADKADFEAAFEAADGAIWILGSGGTARRRRLVRFDPASGACAVLDASALYAALAAGLPVAPNVEGAVLVGDVVRLFHRANGTVGGASASFDVAFADFCLGRGEVGPPSWFDLGGLARSGAGHGVVPLAFTDAAPLGDGRVLYLAAAEDSDDAIADGPVLGAAVGIVEGEGARYALLTEADGASSFRKVEGVAVVPGGARAWLVVDPDDTERASELCEVVLEGPW